MKPLILITNDDGILSPGLAAAAAAMDPLGELLIVAPLDQQTSMGRSRNPIGEGDGTISKIKLNHGDQSWEGYAIKATPARVVEHAVVEIASRTIDLAVSGINYGENIGTVISVSGTVGAALEAADWGIPALAVSQEIAGEDHRSYSPEVDFSTAIHFTRLMGEKILSGEFPKDVDLLKLEIPLSATPETSLVVTRLDREPYYETRIEKRTSLLGTSAKVSHHAKKGFYSDKDTDAYALAQGLVAVTPLSLDFTSRISRAQLGKMLGIKAL